MVSGYLDVAQFHFLHDWYPGVCGSRFILQRCLAQNDRFRPGLFFFIVICGSPNLIHLLFTSLANFLFGPGVQDLDRRDLDLNDLDLNDLPRRDFNRRPRAPPRIFLDAERRRGLRADFLRERRGG